jgi:hypothetical protein
LGDDLEGNGGEFINQTGVALNASDLKAKNVYLGHGFRARGKITLDGAELRDDLVCSGGNFTNSNNDAVSADGLKARNVYLNGVESEGKVRLLDADLDGLYCRSGRFSQPRGDALVADRMKVRGGVFLDGTTKRPFKAVGRVSLAGAELGDDLVSDGGEFINPTGVALEAGDLKAKNISLRNRFEAWGTVNLPGANLNGDLVSGGTFHSAHSVAMDGSNLIARNVNLTGVFEGAVLFDGADLAGNFNCDGGTFSNKGGLALSAESLRATGSVLLRQKFNSAGEVRFAGANLGGDFSCDRGKFANQDGNALRVENMRIRGNVYLREVDVRGEIDLIGTEIQGYLQIRDNDPDFQLAKLNLKHVTTKLLVDAEDSWPQKIGLLSLDGFVYSRIDQSAPASAERRLWWLGRQSVADFSSQPFEELARVMRDNGDDAGARTVLIALESAKRSVPKSGLWWPFKIARRCWSWILWVTIGYGYDIWRAVWFSAALVIVGSLLFVQGGRRGWIISTEDHPDSYKPFNGFIYSLETLLPFVDLYQAKHWVPNTKSRAGRNLRRYLWVHTLLGWFFASMIVAGLSGVVQK